MYKMYYCPRCSWTFEQNAYQTAIANQCPECLDWGLFFVQGPEKGEIADFCGRIGIKAPDWLKETLCPDS